ncbi:MBL fold metallo-hydrolase [Cryomorpha ignava]|uniref:MBL fold metallo-hydrolase n=1 Tax=Cryomorpha ignava TaxID=101383 RepID=A0A7K3WQZ6_9FLAO|nr:MBL fold metallo-hydrolase [Cryomorpha ignava]NEN23135.1 MBL fold metallo-hydrolase [Cryomorpha ignava]
MKLTFLGTGTSQGIPVIGCKCEVCTSVDVRDDRLRTSAMIEIDQKILVIDTGPDFRQQMLRAKPGRVDAVIFTHEHKDHVAGLDDIRPFNFQTGMPLNVYASDRVEEALKREYHYVFNDALKYPGVPEVNLHKISAQSAFSIGDTEIIPIEVLHYKLPVLGFRIKDMAYITDANFISEKEKVKLQGLDVLVLNALRKKTHISHFNLQEAIDLSQELGAKRTYLTHISHLMGKHEDVSKELPPNVFLAYDGLVVDC